MIKGSLSRDQAINIVGLETIKELENLNCEPTNRVGYNGSAQNDDLIEWSSSVDTDTHTITVYYYTNLDDEKVARDNGWGGVDFESHGFEVEEN